MNIAFLGLIQHATVAADDCSLTSSLHLLSMSERMLPVCGLSASFSPSFLFIATLLVDACSILSYGSTLVRYCLVLLTSVQSCLIESNPVRHCHSEADRRRV
ncbi:uncharacterized protein IWZ02DRAFT_279173 [Phyllosticta citriasiana]|uniref:uncharacterized protein n=1 Tax=Phyllosticta citriasiana TaxID=595635 RepID=UPI0030FD549A